MSVSALLETFDQPKSASAALHTLRMKVVPSQAFSDSHAEIDKQSDPCDSYACIALVGGSEIGIVMVVRMTSVCPGLGPCGCGNCHWGRN
jgi:hypothetical protein